MRPSLLLTTGARLRPSETRRSRRRRGRLLGDGGRGAAREASGGAARGGQTAEVTRREETASPVVLATTPCADAAARRVRDAGGPLDEATYNCQCGCLFAAPVTTSVACPHCGGAQAW